jgi:hypothetical protein
LKLPSLTRRQPWQSDHAKGRKNGYGLGDFQFCGGSVRGLQIPEQVGKTIDSGKKMFNDLKDKFTKKEAPPSHPDDYPVGPSQGASAITAAWRPVTPSRR